MAYLELEALSKHFKREKALDGLSLGIEKGEFLVVFGPSGSGKTVLLRLLAGVMEPTSGDIRLNGQSLLPLGPEKRDVAMAFQNFALYPHLSAFENIASPLRARRLEEAEVELRVREVAELLRIDHVLKHYPRELSNGQKQRTSLARSLVRRPSVLLLDDPLRNVDAKIRYEMRLELPRVLRSYQATVLYVTQDYKEAMALGDRVGVLFEGRFQQVDTPGGIYGNPSSVEVARLFGDPPINLLPVRPRRKNGGLVIDLGGSELPAPPALAQAVDRDCLLGLRPEDVAMALEPQPGAIPVTLEAVTPLNVRTVTLLKARDQSEILSSCPEDEAPADLRPHRELWARIDLDRAVCFDRASGRRL